MLEVAPETAAPLSYHWYEKGETAVLDNEEVKSTVVPGTGFVLLAEIFTEKEVGEYVPVSE